LGQKTHPIGFRLGYTKSWKSKWFADKREYAEYLKEDLFLKKYIKTRLKNAGIADIEIERAPKKVTMTIHTARPGLVIGKKGKDVDRLRDELRKVTNKDVFLNVEEVKVPDLSAELVAQSIARQLSSRITFRRAMKKAISNTMRVGAEGIKILVSGRLGGAEMARKAAFHEGKVPLHTLRADIDYASVTSMTTSGTIGVKVWIYKGEAEVL
jgi:small subunit ribosomal protein S3